MVDLTTIAAHTQAVYEKNAARFDAERPKLLVERSWLKRFAMHIPDGGRVLDVGCGSGRPIAQYFIDNDYQVTGVDFSEPMLTIARRQFNQARWICADMRGMELGSRFDGVIAWHSFFHLTPDEQRQTLVNLVGHLEPKGPLLLTVGDQEGEVTGRVGDDIVYHASLSQDEYAYLLDGLGLSVLAFVAADPTCNGTTILLAQKTA